MNSAFQRSLRDRARGAGATVVLPEGHDPRTLDAAAELAAAGVV
jgi:phosphotransacetylase